MNSDMLHLKTTKRLAYSLLLLRVAHVAHAILVHIVEVDHLRVVHHGLFASAAASAATSTTATLIHIGMIGARRCVHLIHSGVWLQWCPIERIMHVVNYALVCLLLSPFLSLSLSLSFLYAQSTRAHFKLKLCKVRARFLQREFK